MLDEQRECVFEEVVGSFFKGDAFEGVPKTFVPLLQLFGEGLV